MRTDRDHSGVGEIIRVAGVRGAPAGPAWSFAIHPGGAAWIADGSDSGMAWLDWLTGIEPPPEGAVYWKGVEWRKRWPSAAAAERGRIGSLLAAGGLIVNLDMDENVWLPARMHRREGAAAEIERWARHFGCWPLPAARASAVTARVRRSIEWIRALAGRPEALVLEQPLREMPAEEQGLCLEAVRQARAAGAAVVWVAKELDAATRAALEPLAAVAPETM